MTTTEQDRVTCDFLILTLLDMRRSNGRGGFLDCWCDSEYGHKNSMPPDHAAYCNRARHYVGRWKEEQE